MRLSYNEQNIQTQTTTQVNPVITNLSYNTNLVGVELFVAKLDCTLWLLRQFKLKILYFEFEAQAALIIGGFDYPRSINCIQILSADFAVFHGRKA